jgi:tripartite-type tricarboxylate transporter receptor subunit TctC
MNKQKVRYGIGAALAGMVLVVIVLYLKTGSLNGPAQPDTVTREDISGVYRDGSIRFLVPSAPGGGFDAYARVLAPYLEKYTGARVRVVNLPGAGGMRAVNELYNSPRDGFTLAIIGGSSMVISKLAGIKGVDYEVDKFEYLGRVAADTRVLIVTRESGITGFDDVMNAGETIKLGATGLGGTGYVDGVIGKEAFGLKLEVIHGFDTLAGVIQAMKRGNLQGAWGPWASVRDTVNSGSERVILQSGRVRNPELPEIPTVFELIDRTADPGRTRLIITAWDALTAVGRPMATSPGTPADRVRFLRDAFRETVLDPEFIRMTQRLDLPVEYASPEEIMAVIRDAVELDPEIEALFSRAVRGEL